MTNLYEEYGNSTIEHMQRRDSPNKENSCLHSFAPQIAHFLPFMILLVYVEQFILAKRLVQLKLICLNMDVA